MSYTHNLYESVTICVRFLDDYVKEINHSMQKNVSVLLDAYSKLFVLPTNLLNTAALDVFN